jgi:hypothetical protein
VDNFETRDNLLFMFSVPLEFEPKIKNWIFRHYWIPKLQRSSSVHNFETRDNLPLMNNAATQSIPLFSKIIKHYLLRISD